MALLGQLTVRPKFWAKTRKLGKPTNPLSLRSKTVSDVPKADANWIKSGNPTMPSKSACGLVKCGIGIGIIANPSRKSSQWM